MRKRMCAALQQASAFSHDGRARFLGDGADQRVQLLQRSVHIKKLARCSTVS